MAKKSESVGMRFDERTRYALELVSRKRHRSYAGVVSDLINRAAFEELSPPFDELWAPDAPSRFLNLVEKAPALLDHAEEMLLHALVMHEFFLWPIPADGSFDEEIPPSQRIINCKRGLFLADLYKLGECWDLLPDLVNGNKSITEIIQIYAQRVFGDETPTHGESLEEFMARMKKRWEELGS